MWRIGLRNELVELAEHNIALHEDGRVATVLRESIEDLQLIIDSLEPVENDLLTVLGTLRYRVQDRLSKSGIELQWNVVDLPPLPMLTPQSVLSILRILQEAGFVRVRPDGQKRFYSLCPDPFRDLDAWVSQYRQLWEGRLDKFVEALARKRDAKKSGLETRKSSGREHHERKSE